MRPPMIGAGAFLVLTGVMAGAFGAHALREQVSPELLQSFQTGAHYQQLHGVALFALGLGGSRLGRCGAVAGALFCIGTVLFSWSLFALTLTQVRGWGAVTPFGGICLMAGWGAILWGSIRGGFKAE